MYLSKKIILIAVLGLIFSPVAYAEDTGPVPTREQKTTTQNTFCIKATKVRAETTTKFSDLDKERTDKREDVLGDLKERKVTRTEKVEQKRDETEDHLSERIAKLNQLDTTDDQKAAIATFHETVKAAMATRKSAVDAAMQSYRTSLERLVTARQEAIKTATTTYKSALSAAATKAQTDCAAGADPILTRQTVTNSFQAAKEKLKADLAATEKNGRQVKTLAKTRNEAVRAANEAFKAALKQAKETLKLAFPQ